MSPKQSKTPLFQALIQRGIADSEKEATALIMGHYIIVNDHKVTEKQFPITASDNIRSTYNPSNYVSRSGEKLAGALSQFKLDCSGKVAMDIGISTGGFTDCLLQHGAAHVIGVDVSYGLTDFSLQKNPKVTLIERQNARLLTREFLIDALQKTTYTIDDINLLVMDVSFISVRTVLPVLSAILPEALTYLILIKPQFECPKDAVPKGGIIADPEHRQTIIETVIQDLHSQGFTLLNQCDSTLQGTKGNTEAFFLLQKNR